MRPLSHPAFEPWGILAEALFAAAEKIPDVIKTRRKKGRATMRPGAETPLWNIVIDETKKEFRKRGAKASLARRLGIPRQRVNDFLHARSRLPNAETTLRLVSWICEQRSQAAQAAPRATM